MISKVKIYKNEIQRIDNMLAKYSFTSNRESYLAEHVYIYNLYYNGNKIEKVPLGDLQIPVNQSAVNKMKSRVDGDKILYYIDINDLYSNQIKILGESGNDFERISNIINYILRTRTSRDEILLNRYGIAVGEWDKNEWYYRKNHFYNTLRDNSEFRKDLEAISRYVLSERDKMKYYMNRNTEDKLEVLKTIKTFSKEVKFDEELECPVALIDLDKGTVMIPTVNLHGKKGWDKSPIDESYNLTVCNIYSVYKLLIVVMQGSSNMAFQGYTYSSTY